MTLTGKETQTGGPIEYLFSEQRPGAYHCGSSIDIRSAAFCPHGRHKRTTTARVTDRGAFSTPPVTTTKNLGRMRQHEKHRTGSSPYTAPGISGSLSALPLSKSSSEHVSRFYDTHCKEDTNGGAHRLSFFCTARSHRLLLLLFIALLAQWLVFFRSSVFVGLAIAVVCLFQCRRRSRLSSRAVARGGYG